MSALRWAWRRRRNGPMAALVAALLACIQWAPTLLGVVIVALTPLVVAMVLAAIDVTVPAVRWWRYERALIRSIGRHPATPRKGTA